MKFLLSIAIITYFLLCLILYIYQRKLIYQAPTNVFNFDEKQSVMDVNGVKLQSWVLNEGKEKALIYYGGNAESIELNISFFKELIPSYTVYLVNYRGYGRSEGSASQKALFDDAIDIYDKVHKKHKSISLMGVSLGSGIASYVASKKEIEKLVLVTPYDSIENVAKSMYKYFPISLLLKDKYESFIYVKNIKASTLILFASNDTLILKNNTLNLINSFDDKNKLKVLEINDAEHNNIFVFKEYIRAVKSFLNFENK